MNKNNNLGIVTLALLIVALVAVDVKRLQSSKVEVAPQRVTSYEHTDPYTGQRTIVRPRDGGLEVKTNFPPQVANGGNSGH